MGTNESKKSRFPSIWGNALSLLILFAIIIGAHFWVENQGDDEMPPVSKETQIILEETDTNPEVEGARVVVVPPAESFVIEEKPIVQEEPKPEKIAEEVVQEVKKEEVETERETPKTSFSDEYRENDPYTSGGDQDLDRLYIEEKRDQKNSATLSNSTKLSITERDQFIPFENLKTGDK